MIRPTNRTIAMQHRLAYFVGGIGLLFVMAMLMLYVKPTNPDPTAQLELCQDVKGLAADGVSRVPNDGDLSVCGTTSVSLRDRDGVAIVWLDEEDNLVDLMDPVWSEPNADRITFRASPKRRSSFAPGGYTVELIVGREVVTRVMLEIEP